MSRLPDYCECSKSNSPKRCRVSCGKPRYPNGEIQTWGITEYSPVYFIPDMPHFPMITEADLAHIQSKVEGIVMSLKKASTPTCLWFTNQEMVGIWDEKEVLDALEAVLTEANESFRRFEPHEENPMGRIEIYCTTESKFQGLRAGYNKLRGTV